MDRNVLYGWRKRSRPHRSRVRMRHDRNSRPLWLEGLEDRMLLSHGHPAYQVMDAIDLITDGAGIAPHIRRLDVLPGNLDGEGVVNNAGVKGVRNDSKGVTPATALGNVQDDGKVDASDPASVTHLAGKKLPWIRNPTVVAPTRSATALTSPSLVANRQRIAQSGRSCHRQRIATLKVSQDRHRSCQRVAVRRSLGVQGDGCTSDASLLSWAWFQA